MSHELKRRYDTRAAAEYLDLHPQTLNNWRFKKRGPAYHKIGDKVFYYKNDLDDFENAGRVDPNAGR